MQVSQKLKTSLQTPGEVTSRLCSHRDLSGRAGATTTTGYLNQASATASAYQLEQTNHQKWNRIQNRSTGPNDFTGKFYQIYKELTPILLQLFQNAEEEGTRPKTFCEATVSPIPNSCNDIPKKENYRPVSQMNTVKILNKIQQTQIQQYIKKIIQHDEVGFILSSQGWLLLQSRFSCVQLYVTPQMAAHQAPPSLGFSRQEYWSGLPFPSPIHESEK